MFGDLAILDIRISTKQVRFLGVRRRFPWLQGAPFWASQTPRCTAGAAETKTERESTPSGDAVAVYASAVGELFQENIRARSELL